MAYWFVKGHSLDTKGSRLNAKVTLPENLALVTEHLCCPNSCKYSLNLVLTLWSM